MHIIASPAPYASAYGDPLFRIGCERAETIELDIYDDAGTTVIGKKRFSGETVHEINVGNYAKRQFDINPATGENHGFFSPEGRCVKLTVGSGQLSANAVLAAGLDTLPGGQLLSDAPQDVRIAPDEQDELAFLAPGGTLTARALLAGPDAGETSVVLATARMAEGLAALRLDMPEIGIKLAASEQKQITGYHTLEVTVDNDGTPLFSRRYRLGTTNGKRIRLCWWNRYGQIDYYTLYEPEEVRLEIEKQRIYTPEGYKTVSSAAQTLIRAATEYEPRATRRWLGETAASPRAWIASGREFVPADIVTERIVTDARRMTRTELEIRVSRKTRYQHL